MLDQITDLLVKFSTSVQTEFSQPEAYIQLGIILVIYGLSIIVSNRIRKYVPFFSHKDAPEGHFTLQRKIIGKLGDYIAPVLAVLSLKIFIEVSNEAAAHLWIAKTAMAAGILFIFHSLIRDFVGNQFIAAVLRWGGMPIVFLHLLDVLVGLIEILESISLSVGNLSLIHI